MLLATNLTSLSRSRLKISVSESSRALGGTSANGSQRTKIRLVLIGLSYAVSGKSARNYSELSFDYQQPGPLLRGLPLLVVP